MLHALMGCGLEDAFNSADVALLFSFAFALRAAYRAYGRCSLVYMILVLSDGSQYIHTYSHLIMCIH